MGMLLAMLGVLTLIGGIVMVIVCAIQKKKVVPWALVTAGGPVLFLVGLIVECNTLPATFPVEPSTAATVPAASGTKASGTSKPSPAQPVPRLQGALTRQLKAAEEKVDTNPRAAKGEAQFLGHRATGQFPYLAKKAQDIIAKANQLLAEKALAKAKVSLKSGDMEKAKELLQQVETLKPSYKDAPKLLATVAERLQAKADRVAFKQGRQQIKEKKFAEALTTLRAISAGFPKKQEVGRLIATAAAMVPAGPELVTKLAEYKSRYDAARNEIKQSAVFNEARKFDGQFFAARKNQIKDWKGWIDKMTTTKGGTELWLRVKIGDQSFGGFKAGFSQGFGIVERGISPTSPVYKAATNLSEDACVIFSAKVQPKENSTSERGAMIGPEYKVRFTDIRACQ